MRAGIVVNVTRADRLRLEAIVADRSAPQKHVWRAKVILATADGCGTAEIMRRSGKSKPVVWTWQARFMAEGVEGLLRDKTRKPGKPPLPPNTVQRVVALALGPPPGESTHWTGRELAEATGVSLRSVQRILEAHQLAPHRIRTFKLSKDPEFVEKLRDIVGLYVDPPAHAVVLSVDEKSQIQALDRTQPGLPMKKGRSWDDDPRLQTPWHNDAVCRPTCSTAPSSAATCRATGTRSCVRSSTPPRRRCRCEWRSTPSSTTTRPTNIPRYKNGWPGIPAGRFTSHAYLGVLAQRRRRLLRQTHETPPQSVGVFRSVADLQAAINRFVEETNSDPKPFVWTADAKRVLAARQTGERKVRVDPLARPL